MRLDLKKPLLALTLFSCASASALEYDYLEAAAAVYPSFDGQDYIGLDLRGSKQLDTLDKNLFTYGGVKLLTDDVDLTAFHVGGAYRFVLEDLTHAWAGMSLDYQKFSNGGSDSDLAFGLRGGVRHQASDDLELGASLRLISGSYDYLGLTGTLRHHWQDDLSWLLEADLYDGNLGLVGGIHYAF